MSVGRNVYIGMMSGTSLDGVDAVMARFGEDGAITTLGAASLPFPAALRAELMALQAATANEIEREALAANGVAALYAECVARLPGDTRGAVVAAHGQTIRHRPELGFTKQTLNGARLAELTGCDVVCDFRSRDVAAGGQGAPLVPAYHAAVFGKAGVNRVVVNIGGIANISVLHANGRVTGYDTGPGNVLMDGWIARHQGQAYDANGAWAASGAVNPALLASLLSDPYFALPAPKSTGRDLFHMRWLDDILARHAAVVPADIQATLTALTAASIADAIALATGGEAIDAVYVCGGGARNATLMAALASRLTGALQRPTPVSTTEVLGVPPDQVEALAFAWLAWRFMERQAGNLPAVTGASGGRILGCLYPA